MKKEDILSELIENIKDNKLIKIVFSDRQDGDFNKIIMKSLSLKSAKNIQIESLDISFMKKKENFIKKENKNNLIKNSNEHNKKKKLIS